MSEPSTGVAPGPPPFTPARLLRVAGLSVGVWLIVAAACCLIGPSMGLSSIPLRLRRVIPASLVGAGLSVAGVALQSLLRNPLAAPSILGINSGATVGAMLAMLAGSAGVAGASGMATTTIGAAAGGIATIVVVYFVAQRRGLLDPYTLLLTGVIVNSFNGAVIMFLYLLASQPVFKDAAMWSMGAIREQVSPAALAVAGTIILAGWALLLRFAKHFNVQALGDDVAGTSGVRTGVLRLATFAAAAIMTAAAVTLSGPIGFVGLIVPHIGRRLFGPDHRTLLVTAGFLGAAFVAAADTFCRSLVWTGIGEPPLGIITAATGGPFFIYLLRARLKETV